MDTEQRYTQAQAFYQSAIEMLSQQYGVTLEAALQIEQISPTYTTTRAALVLKPIVGWQPIAETKTSSTDVTP